MNRPAIVEAAKTFLLDMLADTSRHVDIVSPQLEPLLLDDDEVVAALVHLARRGRKRGFVCWFRSCAR
jgi:acetolactate synthase regulatory subunit